MKSLQSNDLTLSDVYAALLLLDHREDIDQQI
jgi:hypothetical protein